MIVKLPVVMHGVFSLWKSSVTHFFGSSFAGIRNVAKYLSRLGQGFSTSTETVKIEVPDYQLLPDVTRHGFCFTDGIGKITPELAEQVNVVYVEGTACTLGYMSTNLDISDHHGISAMCSSAVFTAPLLLFSRTHEDYCSTSLIAAFPYFLWTLSFFMHRSNGISTW